ncbi:MAG: pyridoxine 5'-phosphate synthase [Kiritimatiellae bacterium]|nr:pyridoxine 5'-phosphate synthase [Kiritimatiellia bacterium]
MRPSTKAVLRLGVNVDHVATVRQARGTRYPDPVEAAAVCLAAGAAGITMHLREDRRHIQDHDIHRVMELPGCALNLEMAAHPDMVRIALERRPAEVCLVPEHREELTTEGGLDAAGLPDVLRPAIEAMTAAGIAVSLFVEPDPRQLDAARALGTPYVELHTGRFCDLEGAEAARELDRLIRGARHAHALGLRVNAGHGIHLGNIGGILEIPHLDTLNIGHSIVARAIFTGLDGAVREMLSAMGAYTGGRA